MPKCKYIPKVGDMAVVNVCDSSNTFKKGDIIRVINVAIYDRTHNDIVVADPKDKHHIGFYEIGELIPIQRAKII